MGFKIVASSGKPKVVATSTMTRGIAPGGGAIMTTSQILGADLKSGMLEGLFEESTPQQIQAVYRDIYFHDPIAGAAVDLKANLPWSDYTIAGCTEDQQAIFNECIERLNLKSMHVEMSVDQMVSGAFVGSLIHRNNEFTDIIPFDYGNTSVLYNALYSEDPALQVEIDETLKNYAKATHPVLVESHKRIPPDLLNILRTSKTIDLDPLTTIYLPRTSLSTIQQGISYYRRIVPIYLLERILYRGTINETQRRQRSTLHVTAGSDDWIPSPNELSEIVALFQATEADPISSVVATRNDIQTQEIRSAGDFYKWTDVSEQLSYMKMRALGINESFLSGESTYGTMEVALSVFIEELRTYRERETRRIYYDKLFPLIAVANNFVKDTKVTASRSTVFDALNDKANLVIPEIHWHKQLRPEADVDYMGILQQLEDKGLPVPLRMWAAAGGYDISKILQEKESDIKITKEISEYKQTVDDLMGTNEVEASMKTLGSYFNTKVGLLDRDYSNYMEIKGTTKTGKPKYIPNQKRANEIANQKAAKALANLSDENNFQNALKKGKL